MSHYRRQVFCIGRVGVPETSPVVVEEVTNRHPRLHALWEVANDSGRLFYDPSHKDQRTTSEEASGKSKSPGQDKPQTADNFRSTAGSLYGLYALKYATLGTAIEGMP